MGISTILLGIVPAVVEGVILAVVIFSFGR